MISTLDPDGVGRQGQADSGDTGRRAFLVLSGTIPFEIGLFQKIPKRVLLQDG